jgi:hypothetical protein
MLSKKQFNAATARLQKSLTTSDLFQMIRYQLTQANKDDYSEIIAQLDVLSVEFKDTTCLDRRRSENYLANALYGKHHSQIAHLLTGNNRSEDEEFGNRAEMYGKFIKFWSGSMLVGDDPLVEEHRKELAKKLRATSPENFKVSYQGYDTAAEVFDYVHQYNVLMYVSFLDLEIKIELIYTRDETTGEIEPIEDSFYTASVNGMDLEQYGKNIGCKHLDKSNNYSSVFALECLFTGVAYGMVTRDDSGLNDFYCLEYPKELMKKHQWTLNKDRTHIAQFLIKSHLISAISLAISSVPNGEVSKHLKNHVKTIFEASHIVAFSNISLVLKGFPQDHYSYDEIIPVEIIFSVPSFESVIVIRFTYENSYEKEEINHFEVVINGGEFIESCSNIKKLNSTEYRWWHAIYHLRKLMPMINSLLIK